MKILIKRYKEDADIEQRLREYGISRAAKDIGMTNTYLHDVIRKQKMSENVYNQLQEILP